MESASRKIRIGEAAAAIGTTTKSLRHWITRYEDQGVKPTTDQSGTWLEFSFGDVAALAITRYLVDLGMPAPSAFTHASAIVEKRWPNLFDEDNPRWSLTASNMVIDFHFGPGPSLFDRDRWWGVSAIEGESTLARLDRSLNAVRDKKFPARATVTLYLGEIISDAFGKLIDMDHNAPMPKRGGNE